MLATVGGLCFIQFFLSTIVTGELLKKLVGGVLEEFLGDKKLLIETFEFLCTFFSEVCITIFFINGVVILKVLKEVQLLGEISELDLVADGYDKLTLDKVQAAVPNVWTTRA